MRVLIVLAALLLVPLLLKFQTRAYREESLPRRVAEVEALLRAEGVGEPRVTVDYLDVTIAGFVQQEADARRIGQLVSALPGARLADNRLVVEGWLRFRREKEEISLRGIVPTGWREELLSALGDQTVGELAERAEVTLAGKDAAAWRAWLQAFFQPPGERAFALLGSRLSLEGEATPAMAEEILQQARSLGEEVRVSDVLLRFPSFYHFPSRTSESPLEGEALRGLSRQLVEWTLRLDASGEALTAESASLLPRLHGILQEQSEEVTFVIGAHPTEGESSAQARARAAVVRSLLVSQGLAEERLKIVPFEMTEAGSELAGQVEVLVR
ncbi:BON domain-containing protein [Roseibacillus ishigakijimensis]|uniref:OmpA family protein n=1 Tax=Roseibacillus ishigakijimensis TaxID=454146 RepID=A0A934VMG1_9BACT|nr:BON domain-containing protein [Roseibacillus ishigakijimensis]MBK1833915.1 hypothetical protein [Roseibacillus ishigakijimensis]